MFSSFLSVIFFSPASHLRLAGDKKIPTTAIETLCVLLKGTWVVNNRVINLVIETTGTYEIFDADDAVGIWESFFLQTFQRRQRDDTEQIVFK